MLMQPCFAVPKDETIISYINLNNAAYYDIEILLTTNEKMLLPFKQLSEIFEVKVKTNHASKEIDFETSDGKKGRVGLDYIELNGKKVSSRKNIYLKKGMMEDIKDEIYCNDEDLSIIFGSKLKANREDLSITAETERELSLLANLSQKDDENKDKPKFKAYTNVLSPEKISKVSFDSVSVSNNTMSDSIAQYLLNNSQKNIMFNNNTQVVLKGRAFDGDLTADMNTYNYKGELFSFGGLGFNYHKSHKNFDYEVGKTRGIKDEVYSIGNQMLGAQVSNYKTKKTTYRDISGHVAKDSLVKVYVDNEEFTTLSTYDGYYSMNNVFLNIKPKSLRLEEVKSDGTTKVIYENVYPKYENMPAEKQKKYTVLAGVTGFNNKLFSQNGYIYEMNTKKVLVGAQFEYGIKENLKFDSKLTADKIYSQPANSIWQNIYSTDALLTSGTWKNPNMLEGATSLNTLEYIKNDNLKYKAVIAASTAKDISRGNIVQGGYSASGEAVFKKDFYTLKASLFNTSPDFYLAGGDGSYINDRTGGALSAGIAKNNGGLEISYKKYLSNTAKRFEGGFIDFNEYSLGAHKNFPKICDVRFNLNGRNGHNSLAKNQSYYYDFNLSRRFKDKVYLQAGKTENNYETQYNENSSGINGYKSLYSTLYLKADCKMPKKLGMLSLGHDIVKYQYSGTANEHNMMKFGYTFPEFKRVTLSVGTGYKYSGSDTGFDFNTNVAYRTKTGRTVNFNYQFNRTGGYIINNMYLPMSSRHSVNVSLNDTFAVLPSGLKSVGYSDDGRGYVDIVAYIDKNKNGIFDKDDIKVKNVPIKCSWENKELYTNKNGKVVPIGTEAGVYAVKIDTDKLPATLYQDKNLSNEKVVRVDPKSTTRVEFPLKSCVGNIKGKLKIVDDFGRTLNIAEFIVVLNDENGEETAYSTVDESGNFYFSGIEPGKYSLKLDDSFINANALQEFEGKSNIPVDIPYTYEDFVDINDLELVYKVN